MGCFVPPLAGYFCSISPALSPQRSETKYVQTMSWAGFFTLETCSLISPLDYLLPPEETLGKRRDETDLDE